MNRRRSTLLNSVLERTIYPLNERRIHAGSPSAQVAALPFYGRIPKEPIPHAKWRRYARQRCADDKDFRHTVLEACEADILFWCNTFCTLFEPRGKQAAPVHLNTWPDQDDVLCWLEECFAERDCGVEKSRGIGMSWNMIMLFYRHWYFDANCHTAMLSWDSSQLDIQDNPGTLMGKLDWLHAMMPAWMRRTRKGEVLYRTYGDHRFVNEVNGSTIVGHTGTDDVLSGDRKAAIFFDEVAKFQAKIQDALVSMQGVTPCRYMVAIFSARST